LVVTAARNSILEKIEKLEAVKTVVEAHAGRRFVIAGNEWNLN
tara:strand:+ start:497 stop:625 length:129 start_codon:yes stop_codon:yes gene_type:complete